MLLHSVWADHPSNMDGKGCSTLCGFHSGRWVDDPDMRLGSALRVPFRIIYML